MLKKIRLIEVSKNRMLYSLPSLEMLSDDFIDGVDWPGDKDTLAFQISKHDTKRREPIADMVSLKKYVCRLNYLADKKELPHKKMAAELHGISLEPFKTLSERRKTEILTHKKYSISRLQYSTSSNRAEQKEYFKNWLTLKNAISIRKNGKVVGLLTLCKMTGKTMVKPLHWITWAWIDSRLNKDERRTAHVLLGRWLFENSSKYVGGSVHAANIRSQKWCLKMGLRPVRIFFARRG